jgi:hypothetical protein
MQWPPLFAKDFSGKTKRGTKELSLGDSQQDLEWVS